VFTINKISPNLNHSHILNHYMFLDLMSSNNTKILKDSLRRISVVFNML